MKPLALVFALLTSLTHAQWSDLWPGDAPGAEPRPADSEVVGEGGRIAHVAIPQYQVYQPEKSKAVGAAVLIFPGGGYGILAAQHEGADYAHWLTERGIVGIVVKYRVSGKAELGYQYPVPFLDARRAIRTARARAAEWGVDPKKIGVMGSSAGGHLASLCATRFADTFPEETKDAIDEQDCRPDFAILIYPVISMTPVGHSGSRKNLLGASPSAELAERTSTEKAVSETTPPCFLLSTADDNVDCRNSLSFAAACKEHAVPVSLHLFESGGHGYGLKGKGDLAAWPELLETWLKRKLSH